jgi:hypothetical protein
MSRSRPQAAIVVFLVALPSCSKRQVAVPVPAPPAALSQPRVTEQPAPPAPQSPPPEPSSAATTNTTQTTPYQVNKPAAPPAPAARKASRPAVAPASPQPAATPAPSPAAPVPAPQLVDLVPPDQQRRLNAAIDQSLSHAQASLGGIANRELNKDQQALVEQIRKLMQQARASRGSDLPGAKSLAERAEVLAKDLAGSFH